MRAKLEAELGTSVAICPFAEGARYLGDDAAAEDGDDDADPDDDAGDSGSVTPPPDPRPDQPTNVRYAVEGSAIRVTWDGVDGADFYSIYHDSFSDSSCSVDRGGHPPVSELAHCMHATWMRCSTKSSPARVLLATDECLLSRVWQGGVAPRRPLSKLSEALCAEVGRGG